MTNQTNLGGTFKFPDSISAVNRLGYGAMQLAPQFTQDQGRRDDFRARAVEIASPKGLPGLALGGHLPPGPGVEDHFRTGHARALLRAGRTVPCL